MENNIKVFGKSEDIFFDDFNCNLTCKVDTGAYNSSIHANDIQVTEDGKLKFWINDPKFHIFVDRWKTKKVKSSNGESEIRFLIKTFITIFGEKYKMDISLTDRNTMRYPVLIGRKFLKKYKIIVDLNKSV